MRFTPVATVALFASVLAPLAAAIPMTTKSVRPPPGSPPAYQARAVEARDDQAEKDWEAFINPTGKGPLRVKLPKVEARDQPAHDWSLVEMPTPGPEAKDNKGVEARGEEESPSFRAESAAEDNAEDNAKGEVVRRRHHEPEHLEDHPEVFQLAGRQEPKPYKQNLSNPPVPTRRGVEAPVENVEAPWHLPPRDVPKQYRESLNKLPVPARRDVEARGKEPPMEFKMAQEVKAAEQAQAEGSVRE